jgi:hypothetical protein
MRYNRKRSTEAFMFPIVALGAAVLVAAISVSSSSTKPSSKESARKEDHPAPLPQSYVVTPIPQGGRQMTALEGVHNFIV